MQELYAAARRAAEGGGKRGSIQLEPGALIKYSECYGGSNVDNYGGVWAVQETHAGRPFHLSLRVPPLGVVFLKSPAGG